jgi:hypothetical protein
MNQLIILPLLALLAFSGCKKDKDDVMQPPPPSNEEEVITTLRLMFTDSAGVLPDTSATFRDPDGDGGQGPDVFDTIRLSANATWFANILLLNETVQPPDTISNEVLDEGDEHLFCFTESGVNVTIVRTDSDGTYPIGLESTWYTGAASTGTVQVTLKHQPGVKDGTCAPGDTDVDVTFEAEVF